MLYFNVGGKLFSLNKMEIDKIPLLKIILSLENITNIYNDVRFSFVDCYKKICFIDMDYENFENILQHIKGVKNNNLHFEVELARYLIIDSHNLIPKIKIEQSEKKNNNIVTITCNKKIVQTFYDVVSPYFTIENFKYETKIDFSIFSKIIYLLRHGELFTVNHNIIEEIKKLNIKTIPIKKSIKMIPEKEIKKDNLKNVLDFFEPNNVIDNNYVYKYEKKEIDSSGYTDLLINDDKKKINNIYMSYQQFSFEVFQIDETNNIFIDYKIIQAGFMQDIDTLIVYFDFNKKPNNKLYELIDSIDNNTTIITGEYLRILNDYTDLNYIDFYECHYIDGKKIFRSSITFNFIKKKNYLSSHNLNLFIKLKNNNNSLINNKECYLISSHINVGITYSIPNHIEDINTGRTYSNPNNMEHVELDEEIVCLTKYVDLTLNNVLKDISFELLNYNMGNVFITTKINIMYVEIYLIGQKNKLLSVIDKDMLQKYIPLKKFGKKMNDNDYFFSLVSENYTHHKNNILIVVKYIDTILKCFDVKQSVVVHYCKSC